MKTKPDFSQVMQGLTSLITGIAILLLAFGFLRDDSATAVTDNEPTARGVSNFDDITLSGDLVVGDDTTFGDDVAVAGDLTVTGSATVSADVTVDDTFNIDDTDSLITGTQSISVTASFYEFGPASVLTLTLDTDDVAVGDLLFITNVGSANVVIVDTGATQGGGNVTIGVDDSAVFIFSNSKWIEIASPDNS